MSPTIYIYIQWHIYIYIFLEICILWALLSLNLQSLGICFLLFGLFLWMSSNYILLPFNGERNLKNHSIEKENHRTHPPPLLWSMLFFEGKLLGRRSWWRCDLTEDDWSIVEVVVSWALLGVPWPLSSHWNSAKTTGCGHEMTLKKVRNVTKIFWALIIFLHLSVMYLFGANTSDLLIFAIFQVLWKTEVPFWFVRV